MLRDVSFTVKGGTTLGVLGETGSGKSTIALLLSRLYDPGEGTITIGGVNVRRYGAERICAAAWASCCKSRSCFPERWRENIGDHPRKRQSGRN